MILRPLLVGGLVAAIAGCRGRPAPAADAGPPAPAAASAASSAPSARPAGASTPAASAAPVASAEPADPEPEPIGGPWVTCYGRFRPTSTARRDVLRLGLLCGPPNGMRKLGDTVEGTASPEPFEHAFDAKAGQCFRVFAIAEGSETDLDVELRSPTGNVLAADHGDDRWPVLAPEGPVCVREDGRHTVRLRAHAGGGPFALEVWKLP